MAVSLIFDDASLVLTLSIILLLSLTIYIGKGYQPLVHPLILSRQSDVSPIRYKGQSAIYRNASSPAGLELSAKPRRKINRLLDVVQYGSDAVEGSVNDKRSFYGLHKSNQDVIDTGRAFASGLAGKAGLTNPSEMGVAVCVEVDSWQSFLVSISGSMQQSSSQAFSSLIVSPSIVERGQVPSTLPSSYSAKQLHAVFTTPASLKSALKLPCVVKDTVIIVASDEEAQSARAHTGNQVMSFDQILAQSTSSASISTERSDAEAGGDTVQSVYWTEKAGWVHVTSASLIAAITAHLALFSAHSQPSDSDHIYVATSRNSDGNDSASSPHLFAGYHPAGLVLPLLALYTGAAFSTSQRDSTSSLSSSSSTRPTLFYASPLGASMLASALCFVSAGNVLARPAARSKMAYLRSGTFSRGGFWDSMVFSKGRSALVCQEVRSVMICGEGNTISQELLDILRIQLGCAVRLAYLPSSVMPVMGAELTAGIGSDTLAAAASSTSSFHSSSSYALATAPLTAVHSLDLQAFTDNGRLAPAHVGAPNVAVELKLVETSLAKSMGVSIEGVLAEKGPGPGRAKDPTGEIFVRGHTFCGSSDVKEWCATGDIGSVRSNGTLVILHSQKKTQPVFTPSIVPVRRAKMRGAGPASSVVGLSMLLLCLLCLTSVQGGPLDGLHPSTDHYKRSDDINSTMAETAITGFLSAPRSAWEQGCSQSALLEYKAAEWSVFTNTKGGPPYNSSQTPSTPFPTQLLSGAYNNIRTQDSVGKLCAFVTGDEDISKGSSLDPASCGEAVLLAGSAMGDLGGGQILNPKGMWISSAQRQLDYMLNVIPKGPSGIISMRSSTLAYWSDAMYMMPPFFALYGLMTSNQTLLQESYSQISLYMNELLIPSGPAKGLLHHIVNATGTTGNDAGAWLTGNGWAAAGMVKVIATITQSKYASQMQAETNQLIAWTQGILDGCYLYANPLISNYVNDTTTFRDAAGSALIAYSTYRLSSLSPMNNSIHLEAADAIYSTVQNSLTPMATFSQNFEVVDALVFSQSAQTSPESLAFLVLLTSAKRDHQQGNVTGVGGLDTGFQGSSASSSSSTSRFQHFCFLLATASSLMLALLSL